MQRASPARFSEEFFCPGQSIFRVLHPQIQFLSPPSGTIGRWEGASRVVESPTMT